VIDTACMAELRAAQAEDISAIVPEHVFFHDAATA
jgi:hypothetical protein